MIKINIEDMAQNDALGHKFLIKYGKIYCASSFQIAFSVQTSSVYVSVVWISSAHSDPAFQSKKSHLSGSERGLISRKAAGNRAHVSAIIFLPNTNKYEV